MKVVKVLNAGKIDRPAGRVHEAAKQYAEGAKSKGIDAKVRRFIIDGYEGEKHVHSELDEIVYNGEPILDDLQMANYLHIHARQNGMTEVHSIVELLTDKSLDEISKLPMEEVLSSFRVLYCQPLAEGQ